MLNQTILSLRTNNRGAALVEFVFVLPIFMLLVFAGTEFTRYLLIQMKVQSAAYTVASIVSQYNPATTPTVTSGSISLDALLASLDSNALKKLLSPYGDDSADRGMIITSIRKEGTNASPTLVAKWQVFLSGGLSRNSVVTGSNPSAFSRDMPVTGPANLLANLGTMASGENMIIVEVNYNYKPLTNFILGDIDTSNILKSGILTRITMLGPRNGDLICLPSKTFPAKFIYSTIPATLGNPSLIGCS